MWYHWNEGEGDLSYEVKALGDIFHCKFQNFF